MLVFRIAGAALLVAAAPAPAPIAAALRDAVIAEAVALTPAGLAFDRSTATVREGGGTTSSSARIDRWNGRNWVLVSVGGKTPDSEQRNQHKRVVENMPVPGYHQLGPILAAATGASTDAMGRTIWLIPERPAGSVFTDSGDISTHLKAEARLARRGDRVWVDQLRITERQPFKLNMLIRVIGFVQTNDYSLGADGRPRLMAQNSVSNGTMFGFPGGETSKVSFTYR